MNEEDLYKIKEAINKFEINKINIFSYEILNNRYIINILFYISNKLDIKLKTIFNKDFINLNIYINAYLMNENINFNDHFQSEAYSSVDLNFLEIDKLPKLINSYIDCFNTFK